MSTPNKVNVSTNVQSENHSGGIGKKSLKSQRTYQVGVVYKDKYGRETPVFTNVEGSFTVPKELSEKSNSIVARLQNTTPDWVDTFKFFIKETSNEYYNACMDRWYDSEDENVWLSFPSAERNKIKEDGFIILKKKADGDEAILEEARYKVIDISNEAPDDIKTDYELYGSATLEVLNNTATPGASNIQFDWTTNSTPWDDSVFYDAIIADGEAGSTESGFVGFPLEDVVVKFSRADGLSTEWLDVANIYKDSELHIQLSKSLPGADNDGESLINDIMGGTTQGDRKSVV